jgi:hypothetical protein
MYVPSTLKEKEGERLTLPEKAQDSILAKVYPES